MKICNKALFISFLAFASYQMHAAGNVIHIQGQDQFNQKILNGKNPAVVKVSASWCGACTRAQKPFEQLAQEYSDITFAELDFDNNPDLAKQYGAQQLPTFLFFKGGQLVGKPQEGFSEPKIRDVLDQLRPSGMSKEPAESAKKKEIASPEEQPNQATEGSSCSLNEQGFFERAYNATRDFFVSAWEKVRSWFQ